MVVRPWQRSIVAMVWADPRPKLAALAIGRGNAKSTLSAAMCLFRLYLEDAWQIDVLAVDERQAGIIGNICTRMASRHPQLAKRVQVYKDHLVVRESEAWWLPATAAALEGRTPDFTVMDEGGRVDREVFEVAAYSNTKLPHAQLFLIGTPGPRPDNILAECRQHALDHPEDSSQVFMEFSANDWQDHPLDCDDHDGKPGCLSAANPALGDWLTRESLLSTLPPKTSESHWRRVRLIQWGITNTEPPLPPGLWDGLSTGEGIPDGSDVVLSFDGSYSGTDATVLLAATVSAVPHLDVVQVWQRPADADPSWRVPVLEVEQAIRDACERWNVVEVAADSYRWARSLAVLSQSGCPVVEFPQTVSRMSAATSGFLTACRNGQVSHSGHPTLAEHLNNAVLTEDGRGGRLVKASRNRHAGRIDAAICAVMGHSRAVWHATRPKKIRYKTVSFA
jgi:phage terminase large subunit-like protein